MVTRPQHMNAYEFVVVSALRTQQLAAGCIPRVDGDHNVVTTAQMEVRPCDDDLLTALRELIEALDRRAPQLQRIGETQIVADAERLRALAVARIAALTGPR